MKAFIGAMAVFMLAGCVTDFEDDSAEFMNGCARSVLNISSPDPNGIVNITLDTSVVNLDKPREPVCIRMVFGNAKFGRGGAGECRLLGGQSNGVEAMTVDESSPLVKPSVHELSQSSFTVFLEAPRVYGFFCEQRPDVAGAVFVE